jgi:flagellar basal-body rod modification protein FlgD
MTISNDPNIRTAGTDSGSNGDAADPAGKKDASQVATKDAFLRLLVAQIRNQNPLNPADGVQFLTQLAQFSELEQMITMRQEVEGLRDDIQAALNPVTDTPASTQE